MFLRLKIAKMLQKCGDYCSFYQFMYHKSNIPLIIISADVPDRDQGVKM